MWGSVLVSRERIVSPNQGCDERRESRSYLHPLAGCLEQGEQTIAVKATSQSQQHLQVRAALLLCSPPTLHRKVAVFPARLHGLQDNGSRS